MKFRLLLSASALFFASIVFGQTDNVAVTAEDIQQQALEMTEEMTSYLDLSETQVERFRGMNMMYLKQKAALYMSNVTAEDLEEKMKSIDKNQMDIAEQVLSEEQFTLYQSKYGPHKMVSKDQQKR
jgi:hypothetical protein